MRAPALLLALLALLPAPAPAAPAPSEATSGQAKDPHSHEGVPERFPRHPAVGEPAPDFVLRDLEGRPWALGEFLGRGHLILLFGSASGGRFRRALPDLDRLAREWERLEVRAVVVYTREAHPAALRGRAPADYPQRVSLAREVLEESKVGLRFLVDEWKDPAHRAYGSVPDSAFLLDPQGTILLRQIGVDPAALERKLRKRLKIPAGESPARPAP